MTSRADFHTHTNASDGLLTPTQLVDLAAKEGLKVLAITDHDSTEGLAEARLAAERHPGLILIPGIEMSTDIPGAEVHVLGYFLDYENTEFQRTLTNLRSARRDRGRKMVEKLRGLGLDIPWERVAELAGEGAVGRPHVAQVLVEKGYIASFQEAFDRYIGRNGPAYVERVKLTPVEAVEKLMQVGALTVLAHPSSLSNLGGLIEELKAAGLAGMEVHYQDYDSRTRDRLGKMAEQHGLLKLGGSDYHGLGGPHERMIGDIPLPDQDIDTFLERAHQAISPAIPGTSEAPPPIGAIPQQQQGSRRDFPESQTVDIEVVVEGRHPGVEGDVEYAGHRVGRKVNVDEVIGAIAIRVGPAPH
jgi:predicted metal-dependent phosphoesterase TrpH